MLGHANAYEEEMPVVSLFPRYIWYINISALSASSSSIPWVSFMKSGRPEGFVP